MIRWSRMTIEIDALHHIQQYRMIWDIGSVVV